MTAHATQLSSSRPTVRRLTRKRGQPAADFHQPVFISDDLPRLAREYMGERFGWVSDPTHPAYVEKYSQVLEAMLYMREREERLIRIVIQKRKEAGK